MAVKHAILVGVGGQGAILTAKVLVSGLMKAGYDVKMSEVHGMSQRGGSVSTQVHWGEKVYSPLIGPGAADVLVAFEKMEAVRYASFLKPEGVAVINDYEQASATIAAGLAEYPAGCLEAMQANFKCYHARRGADRRRAGQRQMHEHRALRRADARAGHGGYRLGRDHPRDRPAEVPRAEPESLPRRTRRGAGVNEYRRKARSLSVCFIAGEALAPPAVSPAGAAVSRPLYSSVLPGRCPFSLCSCRGKRT